MIRATTLASIGLLSLLQPVLAAEPRPIERGVFEATVFGGYRVGGSFESLPDPDSSVTLPPDPPIRAVKRDLADDNALGLILNWAANEGGYYELYYSKQTSELEGVAETTRTESVAPLDLSVEYLHIGGVLEFGEPYWRVVPYFALTVGGTRFSPDAAGRASETEFSAALAGGIKVPFNKHIGLRLDVRGFATWLDSEADIFCVADEGDGTCDVRVHGDSFIQGQVALGISGGF